MRCQEVKPKIYALADGETVNGSQPALYLHLSGCPGCQEEAGRAREITRLLQHSLTQIDPPCDLRALVIPKLNDECSNASEKKFKRVGRKVLALVAGVVFLVGAGFASLASKRIAPDL
ncbi:MAG: zf-HC2 domain-containing protein, partial [Clostridia bacterium]|nr:zf-HC2 domain-containing protein [Clostridia bacterium]